MKKKKNNKTNKSKTLKKQQRVRGVTQHLIAPHSAYLLLRTALQLSLQIHTPFHCL